MHPFSLTRKIPPTISMLAACLALPAALHAEVAFFVQRAGAPDTGVADFTQAAGALAQQDFEDPALGPDGTPMPRIDVGGVTLELVGDYAGPFTPEMTSSPEFDDPGHFENRGLFVGTSLVIQPPTDVRLAALGVWIFDDQRPIDSAYRVDVTERDGVVWSARLENDRAMNPYGHEIEGFVGAVSTLGITRFTITPIDPATDVPHADAMEIDHVSAVAFPVEPPPPGDDASDDENDDDDGPAAGGCPRGHGRPARHGHHGHRAHRPRHERPHAPSRGRR